MATQKNALMDTIRRYQGREMWIEEGEINQVWWHQNKTGPTGEGGDVNLTVVDVILRDRRVRDGGQLNSKYYIKERVPVLQHDMGHHHGHPWNPRVGDLVKVLFYQNQDALVIGTTVNWEQHPVCRPDPYTYRWKYCQWERPKQEPNKDFGKLAEEGPETHPEGKKPFCFNIFHGMATDKPGKGRDFQIMWDFCKCGDKDPSCERCINIDYTGRQDGDHWLKVYSKQTESTEAPPGRFEYKNGCGSYIRIEENCGCSKEYSEGRGMVRIENAVKECDKRSHFNMNPLGTVDIHAVQNKGCASDVSPDCASLPGSGGCCVAGSDATDPVTGNCCPSGSAACTKACESKGHRIRVISDLDSPPESCEMIDLDNGAYVKIFKDGHIEIYSPTYVKMEAADYIHLKAPEYIKLETDIVQITHDVDIDGYCTHADCTCHTS